MNIMKVYRYRIDPSMAKPQHEKWLEESMERFVEDSQNHQQVDMGLLSEVYVSILF